MIEVFKIVKQKYDISHITTVPVISVNFTSVITGNNYNQL